MQAVRLYRRRAGLSLRELALISGMSKPSISRMETHDVYSHGALRKVADALGVPVSELYRTEEALEMSKELAAS